MVVRISGQTSTIRKNVRIQKRRDIGKMRPHHQNDDNNANHAKNNYNNSCITNNIKNNIKSI